jgi:hypothetical protein
MQFKINADRCHWPAEPRTTPGGQPYYSALPRMSASSSSSVSWVTPTLDRGRRGSGQALP